MSREEPQHSRTPLMVPSSAATLHRSLSPTLSSASGLRASGNRERSPVTQTGQMCVCVFSLIAVANKQIQPWSTSALVHACKSIHSHL